MINAVAIGKKSFKTIGFIVTSIQLLGAKQAVAGIAQARYDVGVII